MENISVAEELTQTKKNILFEVTTVSKVLAAILFIVLPFIGGWVGYLYGKNNPSNELVYIPHTNTETQDMAAKQNTDATATSEELKMDWVSAAASADGTEVAIQYPAEIPVSLPIPDENNPSTLSLGIDPGYPNYILPLSTTSTIVMAELTTDLKYVFYLKRDTNSGIVSLYKGTVSSKVVEKITDYTMSVTKDMSSEDQFSALMPLVVDKGFIVYNIQSDKASNKLFGEITSTDNNTSLYRAPCALNRFGNVSFSPDAQHVAWNCREDGAYITDWKNTQKVVEFSKSMNPTALSFMSNERIEFANATEGDASLRAPLHSMKIDGTDLRLEEGTVYLGY